MSFVVVSSIAMAGIDLPDCDRGHATRSRRWWQLKVEKVHDRILLPRRCIAGAIVLMRRPVFIRCAQTATAYPPATHTSADSCTSVDPAVY